MSLFNALRPESRPRIILSALLAVFMFTCIDHVNAQAINENFANVTSLLSTGGWASKNNSNPANPAVVRWPQCSGSLIPPAQAGNTNTCAFADYHSIGAEQSGTINHWLIGPNRVLNNRDKISFYTRTVTGNPFGDRMQVRMSTNGASTDVGTSEFSVGDFTTLLLDINPTYQVGVYPEVWTQYTITISGLTRPTSGRFAFRYFIENGGELGAFGYAVGLDSLVYTPASKKLFDFDYDGKDDISLFRPTTGQWFIQQSTAGPVGTNFGAAGDRLVPADYDGDRRTDVAVFRPSEGVWYVANSSDGTFSIIPFGISEDQPAPGDYDGDGRSDVAVFRPSDGTWYIQNSGDSSYTILQFGLAGDKPAVGDFDGDGKSDISIFRPSDGIWYQIRSSNGSIFGEQFGFPTDKIVQGDYDGDGKTDIAVYRPSEGIWYLKYSATNTYEGLVFGLMADIPTQADFDGDGKTDLAVFRPSDATWYVANSSNGTFTIFPFGASGDTPAPGSYGY